MKIFFSVKKLALSASVLSALTIISTPVLAESVDLTVIGTIIPAACTPALSSGGIIDYGDIASSTLSSSNYTALAEMNLDFTITCSAPAKVAMKAINGRVGTAAGAGAAGTNSDGTAPVNLFAVAGVGVAGLGIDGTAQIGGYGVRITPGNTTADTLSVDTLSKTEAGATWVTEAATGGSLYSPTTTRLISWAATGETVPVAITNLTGILGVQAYLNNTVALNLDHVITLNGMTTLELIYL